MSRFAIDLLLEVTLLEPARDAVRTTLSAGDYEQNTKIVAKLLDTIAATSPGEARIDLVRRIATLALARIRERPEMKDKEEAHFAMFLAGCQEWIERKTSPPSPVEPSP